MGPGSSLRSFGTQKEGRAFDGRVILRLLVFVRPHWQRMVMAFILMLIASGLTLWTPYLLGVAIDYYIVLGDFTGLTRISLLMAVAFAASSL